jgi:FKBP-type peptidyl-prolyl cis-trans isomerase
MPVYFPVQPTQATYDISELFLSLKEGDSVYAAQVMDTFIKRNPEIVKQTTYKNGDKITTSIKILKVFGTQQEAMKDEETERTAFLNKEAAAVKDYISKKNVNAQPVGKGTYVEILEPGTGANVDSGKYVTVKYKGQTFGGIVFDSNIDSAFGHTEPMGFTVGIGQMIKGFDEGVQLLKKGGKARFYIPSMLAYGAQPPSKDIKPYEHLIFDVEVIDILDKAPAQPQMQQPVDPSMQIPK